MREFSIKQAQKFDQDAQQKLGVPSLILMENAGRSVAEVALKMLGKKKSVVVVCGVGNNGGDGLVAARHLANAGKKVVIYIVGDLAKLKNDPKINLNILKRMETVPMSHRDRFPSLLSKADLVIDAIFGIGLKSEVKSPMSDVIEAMNASHKPILAVDVPSGLNANTGKPLGIAIKAKKTVTFVAMKKGFSKAKKYCGKIIVKDIGTSPSPLGRRRRNNSCKNNTNSDEG